MTWLLSQWHKETVDHHQRQHIRSEFRIHKPESPVHGPFAVLWSRLLMPVYAHILLLLSICGQHIRRWKERPLGFPLYDRCPQQTIRQRQQLQRFLLPKR
jgi:hypothetical protein